MSLARATGQADLQAAQAELAEANGRAQRAEEAAAALRREHHAMAEELSTLQEKATPSAGRQTAVAVLRSTSSLVDGLD